MAKIFRSVSSAASLVAWSLAAHSADAPMQPVDLSIDEPAMYKALIQFSQQTGLRLIFEEPKGVDDLRAPQLSGAYTPQAALEKLLQDSGLTYEFIAPQAIAVRAKSVRMDQARPVARLRLTQLSQTAPSSPPAVVREQAQAEQGRTLEEIIVTAEKREESIQDLPIAISAFSEEVLTSRGIDGMEDLQRLAPSLQVQPGNGGTMATVFIRGIGKFESGVSVDSGIAIAQDGMVYSSPFLANLDFFDVERVEVLRGPQGTISGRNAAGGAINVHAKRPTENFEGGLKTTIGNYSRLATEGYLSGPIIEDRLLARLAVRSDRADGWATNTFLAQDLGAKDKINARASLLANVSNTFQAHLIVEGLRDRSNFVVVDDGRIRANVPSLSEYYGLTGFDRDSRTVQHDIRTDIAAEKYQTTLKLAWDITPAAKLTAVTGYVNLNFDNLAEQDGTVAKTVSSGPPDDSAIFWDVRQVSQEITLTADLSDRVDVIAGGLYLRTLNHQKGIFGLPLIGVPPGSLNSESEQELASWAGYTQWRYRLTDAIRLTAGVRYTQDSKDAGSRNINFGAAPVVENTADSWNAWTPRLALEYMLDEDATVYASASRGFRSGGFDGFGTVSNRFGPEFVWNYEAGLKVDWLDKQLRTALTAFHMDYTDKQTTVTGTDATVPFRTTINADAASINGVELELDALITERLRITAGGTWLDAQYGALFSNDALYPELGVPGPRAVNVRDLSGHRLAHSPQWQLNISGEYRRPLATSWSGGTLQGVLRASYAWQDKIYFDFFNRETIAQGAYGLISLLAGIETSDGKWRFSAYASNLADQYYRASESEGSLAPVRYSSVQPGAPRMYGVSVAYGF